MAKKIIIFVFAVVIMILGLSFTSHLKKNKIQENIKTEEAGKIQEENQSLAKTYTYTDLSTKKTATVEMSADGKSVILNYENIKNQKLDIAMSGSGARYANQDETIVFWNKGDNGMILINDKLVFDTANLIQEENLNKSGYNKITCEQAKGVWFNDNTTCEINSYSKKECLAKGGEFNECASACRHDPKAEVCTMQCVLTCSFK